MNDKIEEIFQKLGQFGRYQIFVFGLCCFSAFLTSQTFVEEPFITSNGEYRCYVPRCDSVDSSYNESFLNFTIPYDEKSKSYDGCMTFGIVNTSKPSCSDRNFDTSTRANCSRWKHQDGVFYSTLVTDFDLVCDRAWLAPLGGSAFMLGMVFGAFLAGAISDKYGRKKSLVLSGILYGVFGTASAFSTNYTLYLLLRVLTGVGSVGFFAMSFVMSVEFVGTDWKSFCGIMVNIPFALGETMTGIFAYFIRDWRWLNVVTTAPAFLIISYLWIMPESLRWLIAGNNIDEAIKVTQTAARFNKVSDPSNILKSKLMESTNTDLPIEKSGDKIEVTAKETVKKTKGSLIDILKFPNMRKRTFILFYVWAVCTVTYYGISSNSGNLAGNVFVNFILTMLIEIPSYIVSYFLLEWIGRKGTMSLVLIVGGIACFISGFAPQGLTGVIVTFSLIGKFGIAAAFGSIFVYTAEIYPTEYRGVGLGSCSTCARIIGIMSPLTAGLAHIYRPLPLLIFGTMALIAGILICFLPETVESPLLQTLEESENFGSEQTFWYFVFNPKRKVKKQERAEVDTNEF